MNEGTMEEVNELELRRADAVAEVQQIEQDFAESKAKRAYGKMSMEEKMTDEKWRAKAHARRQELRGEIAILNAELKSMKAVIRKDAPKSENISAGLLMVGEKLDRIIELMEART